MARKNIRSQLVCLFTITLSLFSIKPTNALAAPGNHSVGLGIGEVLLLGELGDEVNDSIGFNLHYQYEASQMFSLLTTFHYSSHSNDTDTNSLGLKGLTPNLLINLAYIDKLVLYAQTGLGLFLVSKNIGAQEGSVATVGFNLGGGFHLDLNEHFRFGTSLSFHNILSQTDSSASPPLSIGGTYINLFLNVFYVF